MFVSNCIKCTCNLIKWYLQLANFESACNLFKLKVTRVPCAVQFDICCLLFACLHYMTLPPSVSVVLCLAVIATPTFQSSVHAQNIYGSAMYTNDKCTMHAHCPMHKAHSTPHACLLPCCCMLHAACTCTSTNIPIKVNTSRAVVFGPWYGYC